MALAKKSVTGEAIGTPPKEWQAFLARIFATGLGTGYAPTAQGTLGSALFVILWVLLMPDQIVWQIVVVVFLNLVSIPLSGWGERMWGQDPGRVTVDEFAGQSIALLAVPMTWPAVLAAFLLFRLFDTFKLPFIKRHVETLPGGWGVTLDDTVAGILARLVMIAVLCFLPS